MRFPEIKVRPAELHKVRGYFSNEYKQYDLLHNHDRETGKSIYRYPAIQFKINQYFSIPVTPDDKYCSYVPTQYLSELFKSKGYNGVVYGSTRKKDKFNLALFDVAAVCLKRREQRVVYAVKYMTNPADLLELK